jgi:hypothetical protein
MGSPAIASWIAQLAFWGLLVYGLAVQELAVKHTAVFLVLWIAALAGLRYLPYGAGLFSPFVALLDIALVFLIFKGDVRLT